MPHNIINRSASDEINAILEICPVIITIINAKTNTTIVLSAVAKLN